MKSKNAWVYEDLGDWINIGLPIFFLVIAIASFVWFAIEIKRKRIVFKQMATWLSLNILFTVFVVYVLIISILHIYYVENAGNIFNMISTHVFGITMSNGKQWVILLILGFISYILIKSLNNSLKIAKLDKRVDRLNKEVAILSGKISKTTNFNKDVASIKKTRKETKGVLREEVKLAKLKKKHYVKLDKVENPVQKKTPLKAKLSKKKTK